MIKLKYNDTPLKKRLRSWDRKLSQFTTSELLKLAIAGRSYAISLAPEDTGATINNTLAYMGADKKSASITAFNTVNRGDGFSLPVWMHTSPNALRHIRSGDPRFMFKTQKWLENRIAQKKQQYEVSLSMRL